MHLVTSRFRPGAKSNDKLLFAGHWCLNIEEFNSLNKGNLIYPSHWEDQINIYNDLPFLYKIYEELLPLVSNELNKIHNSNLNTRQWKIIIGLWLFDFIRFFYDCFVTVKDIEKSGLVQTSYVSDGIEKIVSQNNEDLHKLYSEPEYLYLIYSFLIKRSNLNYEIVNIEHYFDSYAKSRVRIAFSVKRFIKSIFSILYSLPLLKKFKKIIFVASYFSREDLSKINANLRQLNMQYFFDPKPKSKAPSASLRKKINLKKNCESEFEKLLLEILPLQIPISTLENFKKYNFYSKVFFPSNVESIFTANSYYYNDTFNFFVAREISNGAKLLIAQHGAFGESLWSTELDHMIDISDFFYSWGWRHKNVKVIPMPSNKLSYTNRLIKQKNNANRLLFVLNSDIVNYMHSQCPQIRGSEFVTYIDEIKVITDALSSLNYEVKLRLYHTNYGRRTFELKNHLIQAGYEKNIDKTKYFYDAVSESKLVVSTYHPNATGMETISANIPTLFYWNKKQIKYRNKKIDSLYKKLLDIGVLHHSKESLLSHIAKIFPNVDKWWNSYEVRNTIEEYKEEFLLTDTNFIDIWSNELKKHIKL